MSFTYIHAQNFTLNIQESYGSGIFQNGDTIHVWANRAGGNEVFTHWSGNVTHYLLLDNEWHTRMIVPYGIAQKELDLIANFDELRI